MKIGKLFHLTMLVDDLEGPEQFFNSIFSPMCTMRGYSSQWHRYAALYVIADTAIEPMHVLAPLAGQAPTSWYRFMQRYGPRVHNLAFYVDDPDELAARLEWAGVRTTRNDAGTTVFAHPKDTPGMLEFSPSSGRTLAEPRFERSWQAFRRDYWSNHPLGLERLSHVTILVSKLREASEFYAGVLDGTPLAETRPTLDGTESSYVLVGDDTVIELAHPLDDTSELGRELHTAGQGVVAVSFKVLDVPKAEEHLRTWDAPVASTNSTEIVLNRKQTWGLEFRFRTTPLQGDERRNDEARLAGSATVTQIDHAAGKRCG